MEDFVRFGGLLAAPLALFLKGLVAKLLESLPTDISRPLPESFDF